MVGASLVALAREEAGINEVNLHDKSTSLGPTPLVKAVSHTKKGKEINETNLNFNESTMPGPRRQGRQL